MRDSKYNLVVLTSSLLLLGGLAFAQQPGTVRWKVPLDGYASQSDITWPSYCSTPAVGPDGTIYVADGNMAFDNSPAGCRLLAISPQGTTNWTFTAGGNLGSSPAIASDGTIYIGSLDQNLYSLNPSGGTNWVFHTGGWLSSSPALAADGTIYINAQTNLFNKLYAINPDGTAKWVFSMLAVAAPRPYYGSAQSSSPAIGPDGTIYVGSTDTNLYAINPDGTPKWSLPLGDAIFTSPSIGNDGTIYIGSDRYSSNSFHAVGPEGCELWGLLPGRSMDASAAIASDGTIHIADLYTHYALTPQGAILWTAPTGGSGSPALGADGTCYCVGHSTLFALDHTGATVWSHPLLYSGWTFSSPAIGADGTVYIVAGPYLWAFYGSSPPAQSPWPMFRREPTHNARAIQLGLSAPAREPNGAFSMRLGLDIGRSYEVHASSDLASWTVLTNFTSTCSTAQFTDQTATNLPQRFYRLAVPSSEN